MPRGWTGVSLPLISTCGTCPTEKFRSLILSETSSIRSIMGGKSKKLIYGSIVCLWILPREEGGQTSLWLTRQTATILAHNHDKRKQIMFDAKTNSLLGCGG